MHYIVRKFSICKDFPEIGDGYVERYVACTAPVWLVATVRKFSICKGFQKRYYKYS